MNSSAGTEENLEKKRNCGDPACAGSIRELYQIPSTHPNHRISRCPAPVEFSLNTVAPGEPPYLIRRAAPISGARRSELFFRLPTNFLNFSTSHNHRDTTRAAIKIQLSSRSAAA